MNATYTPIAKTLHWLLAVLVPGLAAFGFWMTDLPLSPDKLTYYSWHKWAGVTVFLLAWVRIAWRVTHPAPPLPASMGPLARIAAHAGHLLLYVLMVAIPLTGWLMSSAKGFQTVWFGVLPLPDLLARNRELGDLLARVHGGLAVSLLVLVAVHVGAALFHHFFHRDDVLRRMLPSRAAS